MTRDDLGVGMGQGQQVVRYKYQYCHTYYGGLVSSFAVWKCYTGTPLLLLFCILQSQYGLQQWT